MKAFYGRLCVVMETLGISQVELAERTGISAMQINHYCKGRRLPCFECLAAMVKAMPSADVRFLLLG